MRKFFCLFFLLTFLVISIKPRAVFGAAGPKCSSITTSPDISSVSGIAGQKVTLTAVSSGGQTPITYSWTLTGTGSDKGVLSSTTGNPVTWTVPDYLLQAQSWTITATATDANGLTDSSGCQKTFNYYSCGVTLYMPGPKKVGEKFEVKVNNVYPNKSYYLTAYNRDGSVASSWGPIASTDALGGGSVVDTYIVMNKIGTYSLGAVEAGASDPSKADTCQKTSVTITAANPDCPNLNEWDEAKQCCKVKSTGQCNPNAKPYCGSTTVLPVKDAGGKYVCEDYGLKNTPWDLQNKCDNGTVGIETALGCVPTGNITGSGGFIGFLLRWVFGISGGIVILSLIITGYNLLTSAGNPEKLAGVKENLISIFSALILLGFSLVLLNAIGADILKLPSF